MIAIVISKVMTTVVMTTVRAPDLFLIFSQDIDSGTIV
jgi:hypothetical protein